MTKNEAVKRALDIARDEIGYLEKRTPEYLDDKKANAGSGNFTKYARDLDALKVTWGDKQGQFWCAEWKLWVFYKAFGIDMALKMLCSPNPTGIPACRYGYNYMNDAGRIFKTPEPGDIVFFYYSGDVNHEGIVETVNGNTFTTIEGNSSDGVNRRNYYTSYANIAGFGRPKWDLLVDEPTPPEEDPSEDEDEGSDEEVCTVSINLPILSIGDKGTAVRAAQGILIANHCSCGVAGADGEFGNGTLAGVKVFQSKNGLEADGVIGIKTYKKFFGIK